MPTIAACSALANAAFTCVASDAYKASASSLGLGIFIENLLQDYGGRLRFDLLITPLRKHRRRVSLIHQRRVHAEAAMQLVRKAPAPHGHFVFGAVRMARQSDDTQIGPPLADQFRNRRKFFIVGCRRNAYQRLNPPVLY